MAILRRKANGQLRKALVRVGDIAVCSKDNKLLGITANRGYKVLRTGLTTNSGLDRGQFEIVSDLGELIVCRLPRHNVFGIKSSAEIFGAWSISSVRK